MNCVECKAIVSDGTLKRCRACINESGRSIAQVKGDYRGWLMTDIIEALSHRTGAPMPKESYNVDAGVPNSGGDAVNCQHVQPTAS